MKRQDGFFDGKSSSTNVSRAICAFCNFFNIEPSYLMSYPNYFIWSMLGLEALFANGTQGVQQQIKDKSSLTLNLQLQDLKLISKLYNYRSRFFHGQTKLYNPHLLEKLSPDAVKLDHETSDYHCQAFTLFLISLQYCAEHNLDELKFEYIQV